MQRVSAREAARIATLSERLSDRTLRTLLTAPGRRLVRPERLDNLVAGRGKLSETEREQLQLVSKNSADILKLQSSGRKQRPLGREKYQYDTKVNRAIRDWLQFGKEKGVIYQNQDKETRESQYPAIRALAFLGVDPQEHIFYVKRR